VGDEEDMVQVDPILLVPQPRIGPGERARVAEPMADVVDQHIDPAESVEDGSRQSRDLLGVAHVRHDGQSRPAGRGDLVDGLLGRFVVDVGDDHQCAVLREQPRGGRADAGSAARDDRDAVGQERTGVNHGCFRAPGQDNVETFPEDTRSRSMSWCGRRIRDALTSQFRPVH
jgi:hypothetical protein